jgi:hypothetical protein
MRQNPKMTGGPERLQGGLMTTNGKHFETTHLMR